jgi:hypothetical protein
MSIKIGVHSTIVHKIRKLVYLKLGTEWDIYLNFYVECTPILKIDRN